MRSGILVVEQKFGRKIIQWHIYFIGINLTGYILLTLLIRLFVKICSVGDRRG